jgi:hypothetical protein
MTFGPVPSDELARVTEGSSPAREVLSESKTPKHVDTDDLA